MAILKTLEQRLSDFHTLATKTMGITYYETEFQADERGSVLCIIRAKVNDKWLSPVIGEWVADSMIPHSVALAIAAKKLLNRWVDYPRS